MKIPFFKPESLDAIAARLEVDVPNAPTTAIVVDLETLDTEPTAAVFNVAALFFSLDPAKQEELEREYPRNAIQFRFDPLEQIILGRTVNQDTIGFWQNPKRRDAFNEIQELPISEFKESMQELYEWINGFKDSHQCRVYCRGQDFDMPLLRSLYATAGVEYKWRRGDAPRDIRSYVDAKLNTFTGYVPGVPKEENQVSHTALGDCYNDARQMQAAYYLNNLNKNR